MSLTEKELEELHAAGAFGRTVMETVADAVVTVDEGGTVLSVNRAAERIFGYAATEMLGAPLTMLMPDYLRRMHEEGMRRYVETGVRHISWEGVELPGLHKSGRELPLEISFGEFTLGGRRYFTGVARDISSRKRTEARLAAQYEVTRALAESQEFRAAVPRILRAVCEALGWELGMLWALDREAGALTSVESWRSAGVDVAEFERFSGRSRFARGEGLPGRVWERGEPLWVEDLAGDASLPRASLAARTGLHAALAFPVLMRGEVVAVLEFFSRELRPPDRALLDMMAHVGSQMGQVVERQRAEVERARMREEVISAQTALLEKLSTPLIPLNPQVVLMPLVGEIDEGRARRMLDALLHGLEHTRSPVAIIDITGVEVVDARVADTLVRASHAARLLGTEVVLTGIRAGVARSLVGLGVELSGIHTRKTLQQGIACALERLRKAEG